MAGEFVIDAETLQQFFAALTTLNVLFDPSVPLMINTGLKVET